MQLICALVTGGLYYRYSANSITEVHAETMNKDISLIENYLTSQMEQLNNVAYGMGTNQSLAFSILSYIHFPTTKKYIELTSALMDKLIELHSSNKDIIYSAVYLVGNELFYDYTNTLKKNIQLEAFLKTVSASEYAFPLVLDAQKNPFFVGNDRVVPLVYRYRLENQETYLVLLLDVEKLKAKLADYSYAGELVLLDGRGNVIFSPEMTKEELNQFETIDTTENAYTKVKIKDSKYITTFAGIDKTGWKIFALKDEAVVLAKIRNLLTYILLLFFIVYILEWIVLYVVYKGITSPIEKLATLMEKQSPARFTERFKYPYDNEIGRLSKAYDRMMDEIDAEEKQIEWEQKQKRLAEIKSLQAQINPHFLYNSLNSISWLAISQGSEDSANLANLLANYYRISLSKGEEFISVKMECEHVLNYLRIQQIRYADILTYSIDIPSQLHSCPIVKIILQPLVENAIYHGIKPKVGPGHITISARQITGTSMEFCIEDDGIGINADKLEAINKNLSGGIFHSETGYGIYNVNARIQLTYGKEYGLVLESQENVKTVSRLTLPLVLAEGVEQR
jgi:two-component system sensor histidine kinase YesM